MSDADAGPSGQGGQGGHRRNRRACVQCRKLKRTCDGGEPPCARCRTSGAECVFERPQSSVVYDAGLTRLAAIEASLALQERRLDTVVESIGQANVILAELASRLLKATGGLPAAPSPAVSDDRSGQQVATPALAATSLLKRGRSVYGGSEGTTSVSPNDGTFRATANGSSRFTDRIAQPIEALAQAEEELPVEPAAQPGQPEAEEPKKKSNKRQKLASPTVDVVSKGIIDDAKGRQLVLLWMKEISPFCPILDTSDTYESLRERSPLLVNTMMYIAARTSSIGPPSAELLQLAEETRRLTRDSAFEAVPRLETIQALLIAACFHPEPYLTTGVAFRLALAARYETSFDQLESHGWAKTDDVARRLTAQLRAFLYAVFLDFKHSRYTGRLIPFRQQDLDALAANIDKFLTLPLSLPNDYRHVANLKYIILERQIFEDTTSEGDIPLDKRPEYVLGKQAALVQLHQQYDHEASSHFSHLSYPRRSHLRIYHDANLFLLIHVHKQDLFDAAVPLNVARDTLASAHEAIKVVLQSPAYCAQARYSGYLLHVDLSFAAMLLLKLSSIYPDLVDDHEEVGQIVLRVADLLSSCNGSGRHATMLRSALGQYRAKTRPPTPPVPLEPTATLPSEFPTQLWDSLDSFTTAYHDGSAADPLFGGETGIDWTAPMDATFFDSNDFLLNHDWMSTLGSDFMWQNPS